MLKCTVTVTTYLNLTYDIIIPLDSSGVQHPLALIVYKFDGVPEHQVLVRAHGNSSKQRPYYRTAPSVRKNLSTALSEAGKSPKEAVDNVLQKKGGLVYATSAGQIPRNRKQAYNIKFQSQGTRIQTKGEVRDILFVTMEQCKRAQKGQGSSKKLPAHLSQFNPHLVKRKGNLYTCDHHCMHFQSLCLCSHTVAAASRQDDLSNFLQTLAGKIYNLYQFSKHGMLPGAGRKGGKLPRKKLPKRPLMSHVGVASASSASSEIYQSNQHSASTPILSLAGSSVTNSRANQDHQPHVTATYSQPVVSMPTVQPAGLSSDQSVPPVHTVYS